MNTSIALALHALHHDQNSVLSHTDPSAYAERRLSPSEPQTVAEVQETL